jgi:hypothetical protein
MNRIILISVSSNVNGWNEGRIKEKFIKGCIDPY